VKQVSGQWSWRSIVYNRTLLLWCWWWIYRYSAVENFLPNFTLDVGAQWFCGPKKGDSEVVWSDTRYSEWAFRVHKKIVDGNHKFSHFYFSSIVSTLRFRSIEIFSSSTSSQMR
jgi:hypothetical protein